MDVLVLGDGLLGSEIVKQTGWKFLSRKSSGFEIDELNTHLSNFVNVDVIVNCIACTDTYDIDSGEHWMVNCTYLNELILYCNIHGIKLVHISTDYVYAESDNNASEDTTIPIHGKNWYSYTKLLGDGLVQIQSDEYMLCRCTHKPRPFPYDNAWVDQVGNFDYVDVIAGLIIQLINKDVRGTYNVGTEVKTMYELASQTKKVGKSFTPSHVPKNQSMNLDKLKNTLNYG